MSTMFAGGRLRRITLFTPLANNATDLGSSTLKFKDLYLAGNASIGGTTSLTGLITLAGGLTMTGSNKALALPLATGLTAAGSSITDALQLAAQVNIIGTAAAATGAKLWVPAAVGTKIEVKNTGANTITLYPPDASGTLNGGSAGVGLSLPSGSTAVATYTATNTWHVRMSSALTTYPTIVYAAGSPYSLTNSNVAVDFGTTDPAFVLSAPGKYRLQGGGVIGYTGATFAANRDVTMKLRRTNNTAADVTGSSLALVTDTTTTATGTLASFRLPDVIYSTANSDDAIAMFGGLNAAPSAGTLDVTSAWVSYERLAG